MNKPYTIEEIRKIAVPIAQQYGVEKLALFGSYANGVADERSDIDFIIKKGKLRGLNFFGFINSLEDNLGVSIDMATYESLDEYLSAEIIGKEVVLYE